MLAKSFSKLFVEAHYANVACLSKNNNFLMKSSFFAISKNMN